tara:strand:- start:364 stop:525 length:162 start_codon:yes stop_codon:yes gene_type:complete
MWWRGHAAQLTAPVALALKEPGAHAAHALCAEFEAKKPAEHAVHSSSRRAVAA